MSLIDLELSVLEDCVRLLWQLDPTSRRRVIEYLMQRDATDRAIAERERAARELEAPDAD